MFRSPGYSGVSKASTRKLTGAVYGLTVSRKRPLILVVVLSVFLLGGGGALGLWWQQSRGSLSSDAREEMLKQENAKLAQTLRQAELQAQHEASLRESLERQLAEQSEEVKRLRGELAFFQRTKK